METLKRKLNKLSNEKRAQNLQRFFKTGKGEYGEGDIFIGLKTINQKQLAKEYKDISLRELEQLLKSRIHEQRSLALEILKKQYKRNKELAVFYLKNIKYVNNWDLVDMSAPHILGDWLLDKDRSVLYELAGSENLWKRRISIVSCFTFIRQNDFKDALKISKILLKDKHDLIHKAVGWMLREVGKRDLKTEEKFLKKYYSNMPRTMLRYAIEKFNEKKRQAYLKGKI